MDDANIPFFNSSNKQFEEMYYFRWYCVAEASCVKQPTHGYLITEWLHRPDLPDNSACCPMPHPFISAKRDGCAIRTIADDYARILGQSRSGPRNYSFPWAGSVRWSLRHRRSQARRRSARRSHRKLQSLGRSSRSSRWSVLADRYPRRHGEIHRRRRLSHAAEQLHARRCACHRRFRARVATVSNLPPNTMPRPARSIISSKPDSGIPKDQFYEDLSPANRLRHPQREAIQGPRHATPVRRRARTHRLHSLAVLCAHPEPRHRLEATLRSQRIRRQIRAHHRRAAQPALPLRLGRSMHVERPLMAIRHHANLAGIGQFAQRPRTDVSSASSSTTSSSRTTFSRSTSSCPAVASSTGSTKISTPTPMSGSRRTC